MNTIVFTNTSAQTGYDTRSNFKWSVTGWNSVFLLLDYLPNLGWRNQSALLFTHSWSIQMNTIWEPIIKKARWKHAICIKVKNCLLATIVESDLKAPFLIAMTTWCRGGRYSFPWIAPFTFEPYLIMLSVKQGGIKYHFFESLVWLNLGLNPGLLGHWWTL